MFTQFWSAHNRPGFHPTDEPLIPSLQIIDWTYEQGRAGFHLLECDKALQHKVHRNLFAIPCLGNMEMAKVFILFGNPGVGPKSYEHEHSNQFLVSQLTKNLQGKTNIFSLDPRLEDTGGFHYWHGIFRHLAEDIARQKQMREKEAFALIAQRVAVLEACAYRSYRSPGDWIEGLPSSKIIREYVHESLVPSAEAGAILIFVWRCAEFWEVRSHGEHIIVRDSKKAPLGNLFEAERKAITGMLLA